MSGEWLNALLNAPNPGTAFTEAYNNARERKRREAQDAEDQAWRREERGHMRSERQRESEFRGATSDMILSGGMRGPSPQMRSRGMSPVTGQNALAGGYYPPANALGRDPLAPLPDRRTMEFAQGPQPIPPASMQDEGQSRFARERAIRANPEGFLTFEGKRLDLNEKQLKGYRDLNSMAMQLLGGVNDQTTFDAAKQRAAELYSSYDHDASEFISGLPPEYSPDLVESLRLQGMDTARQMQAIARENRLEWDMEDDRLDNNRADESQESLQNYRGGSLKDRQTRTSRMGSGRGGQPKDTTPRSENALFTDIQRRFNKGEAVTDRERQFARDYIKRRTKAPPKGRTGGGSTAAVRVKSIEEARKLPAGTVFVTPDGRTKVR